MFADLGYPDSEERQTQLRLAHALNQIIAQRRLISTTRRQSQSPQGRFGARSALLPMRKGLPAAAAGRNLYLRK